MLGEKKRWMEPQTGKEGAKKWLFFLFYDFEADGKIQFNILSLHRKPNAPSHTQLTSTILLPIYSEELKAKLGSLGFRDIKLYGNLAGELFGAYTSGDMVLIVYKA